MKNSEVKDLRFNVTEDMNNTMIEMLLVKEMLLNNKPKKKERALLQNHFNEMSESFVSTFRENNKSEIENYNDLMKQ